MSAIQKLAGEIVDYAGLFPPAQLPLNEVIENFESYLNSNFNWMLSRLVLPVSKLAELETSTTFQKSENRWRISALVPPVSESESFDLAFSTIAEFNRRHDVSRKSVVDSIEIQTPTVESIVETGNRIPDGVQAFCEIPHLTDPFHHIQRLSELSRTNLMAKIRTGGVTEDLIPTPSQVARFIACCADSNVGLKATAGLHHPIRGEYRLTYDQDADSGTMFGFLNIFVAGCFAFSGHTDEQWLEKVLTATDPGEFSVSDSEIQFAGQSVDRNQIESIRNTKLTTFGSCSFTEPTNELAAIGWLQTA